jgi:hypothetical protein
MKRTTHRWRDRLRLRSLAVLTVVGGAVAALVLAFQPTAGFAATPAAVSAASAASTLPADVTTPVTGNATHFDGLGSPYGGCGLPQSQLDAQDFVALNVFNTPGDYSMSYPRPLPASLADKMGLWDNGQNCGRFVQVSIGDYCTGTNDGAAGQPFCRNGSWVSDDYNGATLTMVVADSCADPNAWCRDDPYHLDLDTASLGRFQKNGTAVSGLADHWNNRHVSWNFVPAPNYSGDIKIGFLQGAQPYWGAVAISHLANGIHGVQYYSGGGWHDAQMNGDMGESYILSPTTSGGTQFTIRVADITGSYINGGRQYTFSLPSSCTGGGCTAAYTGVSYTAQDPSGGTSTTGGGIGGGSTGTTTGSTTSGTTTGTTSGSTAGSTTTGGSTTTSGSSVGGTTATGGTGTSGTSAGSSSTGGTTSGTNSGTTGATTGGGTGGGCSATAKVSNSWSGGFQVDVTVANNGTSQSNGWKVGFTLPSGDTVSASWNASLATSGSAVTASSLSYNGSLSPGGSTGWGMTLNGSAQNLGTLTCTSQ